MFSNSNLIQLSTCHPNNILCNARGQSARVNWSFSPLHGSIYWPPSPYPPSLPHYWIDTSHRIRAFGWSTNVRFLLVRSKRMEGCIAAYISIIIITIQTMMIITNIMMTITTKNMMIITILTMTIIDTIEYFQSAAPQVEMKCRTLRDPRWGNLKQCTVIMLKVVLYFIQMHTRGYVYLYLYLYCVALHGCV